MAKVYKSKVGYELVIPLTLILGASLFMTVFKDHNWWSLMILIPLIVFIVYIFLTTYYVIDNDILRVKCGFMYNSKIEIKTIKGVAETYNPLSSPALSLDRLEISYNKYDRILISPKDKKEFINVLLALNPGIELKLRSH